MTRALPTEAMFAPEHACWICGGIALRPVTTLRFELSEYRTQDPELAAYTGARLVLQRCAACGFAQPAALPVLARYFDRMYDQRWSADWIAAEHDAPTKDRIFVRILDSLERRLPSDRRRLIDVGAHAGRFVALARARGWDAEGLELNPQTCAYAAARTGARIRQANILDVDPDAERFDAITLTDVLEHIPRPLAVLRCAARLLAPGGWLSIKVPSGRAQIVKERWRGRLVPGYRPTIADNLVHVSHFSPDALARALTTAGLEDVSIEPGVPELSPGDDVRHRLSRALRLALYHASCRTAGGVSLPICLNLQAYARRPLQ